jgi:hypothetical protein
MGGQQSTPCGDHCFLGKSPFTKRASLDILGSPEPETPAHQRRKRAEVVSTAAASAEVRSSMYPLLEKEVADFVDDFGAQNNHNTNGNASQSIVHEGPVSS